MNALSQQFHAKSLLQFALPSVLMMVFMSMYTIVDGMFVANLVGEDALSAVNLVMPSVSFVFAIGLMFATGGTAVMGRLLGEGKAGEARSFLSTLYCLAAVLGVIYTTVTLIFADPIVHFLGAEDALFALAKAYFIAMSCFATTFFFQVFVQLFFVLSGRPALGFAICFAGGMVNIALDYALISPNLGNMGIVGAGIATGVGNTVPAVFGLFYFAFWRKGSLYFAKPQWNLRTLLQSMGNGMSEMVSQMAMAITTLLFNLILLRMAGQAGVAAISVILYLQMLQSSIYLGYSIGIAPVLSYKYGAQDHAQLKGVIRTSLLFLGAVSLAVIVASLVWDDALVHIFIQPTSPTFAVTKHGLRLFSIAYLFMGVNIFMSAMFTALSNGVVSALLAMSRTLVFLVLALLGLPLMLGLDGVWLAVPVAEGVSFVLAWGMYRRYRSRYGY